MDTKTEVLDCMTINVLVMFELVVVKSDVNIFTVALR